MKVATLILAVLLFPAATLLSQPPQKDVPAELDSARSALKGALNDLQHGGSDWGGHKAKAMQHINEAVSELNEAEKFAKEHHAPTK